MNRNTVENSVLEEKKKNSSFFSRFYANSRVLVIILSALVITVVSIAIFFKSSDDEVLYENLSNEDKINIVNELEEMNIPYHFSKDKKILLVPKDYIHRLHLHFSENSFSENNNVGFELLDQEKFGISQFNEKINYQRALEGELSRTIQKINIIKNARIHIALPESSLFLRDKKESSASVILHVKTNRSLDNNQINAIAHFISSSVPDLPIKNITILDQFGKLLNHSSLEENQINDMHIKYIEAIENRYQNRIQNILEPILGVGNVHAQVTAQVNFNTQERTQEQYSPNVQNENQSMRSRQTMIHDEIDHLDTHKKIPNTVSNNISKRKNITNTSNNIIKDKNVIMQGNPNINYFSGPKKSNINHEDIVNYELNHLISHTKMNIGEIKRLSAAVVVNFIKDQNGKLISLTEKQLKNINHLVREAIGYSSYRGDSIYVMNDYFIKKNIKLPIQLNHSDSFQKSSIFFPKISFFLIMICVIFIFRKYYYSSSKNIKIKDIENNTEKNTENNQIKSIIVKENIKQDLNVDDLIRHIISISNKNPRIIALIIRKWMSNKI
ncbi:flagellar basal-body MS-ring/collar protein FliF [Buchnera aphidicola]|uniref:flagellar basal-body MS-ring/collar protein FliF n=1 Tax=Buchnera aphidicola TaxID=9 RepID=UPI003BEF31C8